MPVAAAVGGFSVISVNLRTVEAGSFFGVHFAQRKLTDVLMEGSQPVTQVPLKLLYCHCWGWDRVVAR